MTRAIAGHHPPCTFYSHRTGDTGPAPKTPPPHVTGHVAADLLQGMTSTATPLTRDAHRDDQRLRTQYRG
ncbi:unnamed protein product [Staurois parvus]|uniref:Uncharacterized protein n=1 Tax=Staurois parvus TaxID=386267 RepID=A0ABN9G7Q3_9NEOB|nr:unnamed protein product [Staurois parvus]